MSMIEKLVTLALLGCAALTTTGAEKLLTLVDLPVSATNNALYLASAMERPWWDESWAKRVPLLVAGRADEADEKVVVDVVVDFGEKVRPEEVRVVTPWEEAVPCVAEKVKDEGEQRKIRLLFKTSLRPHQNKPFLVYYGNPNAKAVNLSEDVTLETDEHNFRVRNGVVDVVFDRRHVTEGLIRSLRILGSTCRTVLFDCANGYPKAGFEFHPNADNGWDEGTVVMDNAFGKEIRFDCKEATLTFALYAEQPRVDWRYELKDATQASIRINWGVGGSTAFDDFFYCGRTGRILTQRGGLDFVTDCMEVPKGRFEEWLSEGWYAFGERRMADIAGLAFDRSAASHLEYSSYYGAESNLSLVHRQKAGERASGAGAIIATLGTVGDFRKIVRRIERPLAVSVGAVQVKVKNPLRIPRLDRDWCCDYNVGYGYPGDSGTGKPLPKDPSWATSIVNRMRSYGSTTVCLMGYNWWDNMPIEDKSVYDRIIAESKTDVFENPNWRKWPTWEEMKGRGQNLLDFTAAIHAKGMGVHTWCSFVPGFYPATASQFSKTLNDLSVDIQDIRVKCGQDCAYSNVIGGEGVALPGDLVKKNNGASYWAWENPQEAFDAFDRQHTMVREFYTKFKAKHPDIPVFLWNSENGEIGREKFMSEDEGYFDTMVVEMLPHAGFGHTKHVAKRMRSHFNNRAGHTVWHHYYIMNPKTEERIWQVEWPFICGVNGYSQENLTYEATDLETSEVTADFFRFAEYTRLGEKVAKMAPVKNVGVYRDPKAFREDVLKKRLKKPYPYGAQQDGRVRAFSEMPNFNYDVIGPKFFTAKDLAQYRVVYVPEDDVLSDAEAKELFAYVKNGGSAVIEGVTGEKAKAKDEGEQWNSKFDRGEVVTYGKGKIVWLKEVLTDRLAKRDGKAIAKVRKLFDSLGGVEPYTLTGASTLDGNLQAGPEGMFLGLYNSAKETRSGKVTLHCQPQPSTSISFYALDVKAGTRQSVTNGTFTVSVGARQCGYFLIGDEAFTAVPEVKSARWTGSSVVCANPNVRTLPKKDVAPFKPAVVVEFVRADSEGNPVRLSCSARAKYDERCFTEQNYDPKTCKAALAEAKVVHVLGGGAKAADLMFADCAEELKALLKRGGSILFTMLPNGLSVGTEGGTGKFLSDVGVFNPSTSIVKGVFDGVGAWCGPNDHPYLTSDSKTDGVEPKGSHTREWRNWWSLCEEFPYDGVYSRWDGTKQRSLFRPKMDTEGKYSGLVVQEGVMGSGRVLFSLCTRSFGDWYEPKRFDDNLMSWLVGVSTKEHAKMVTELNGGPGEIWKKYDIPFCPGCLR